MKMLQEGQNNVVNINSLSMLSGKVSGNNNRIEILSPDVEMHLYINGSNNMVQIGTGVRSCRLSAHIGSHVKANNVTLEIGNRSSFEPDCKLYLYNDGNSLRIGEGCMFSNSIIVRTGESPHLIFDDESGAYLDTVGNVTIGDHCWIGERSYITKKVTLAAETIVAACSVVTRQFSEEFTVLAGNPATVKRRGVRWIRNHTQIPQGSKFEVSYKEFLHSHTEGE
jgi:acetyltransferase-like isoleucine patch superfamily enzyme